MADGARLFWPLLLTRAAERGAHTMSIHHRKQGAINRRRQQIADRKRGGVLGAWVAKIRRLRHGAKYRGDAADADEDAQCDTMISSTDRRTSDGVAEGQHKMGLTWPELIGLCILWVVVLVYTL